MKKLSLLLFLTISTSSVFAMEEDAKGQEPKDQDRMFNRSYRPPVVDESGADYTVMLGQEFIVAEEESKTAKYRYDQHYSSTNLFELVQEYYANGQKTHYFVFKAICQGAGTLNMIGERSQPENTWKLSYKVVVE